MQRIAIYDMDKTITRRPTWTPFMINSAQSMAPWRLILLPLLAFVALGYAARLIDRGRLKEIAMELMIGRRVDQARMSAAADRFADRLVATGLYRGALDQIAADRAAGYRIVLATASFGYYVAAIAVRLGIDDVIATQAQRDAKGRLIARIDGENCYGPAKLAMIKSWLADQALARNALYARFYSDHVSDAPALGWADQGFAVNPHPPLRALAAARGWAVLDWDD